MPIEGKFYSSKELQKILNVGKQRISHIAKDNGWLILVSGSALYCAEQVEDFLMGRGIDPDTLSVRDYEHPDGATWADLEAEYAEVE
jgi:hypothetical protein